MIYTQVKILREHNFEAFVLHFNTGFRLNWLDIQVPVVYMDGNPPISPGDTVVIPEGFPNQMKGLTAGNLHKVVIALNLHYIFEALPPGESWRQYGISAVITSSDVMAEYIRWAMGVSRVGVVNTAVNPRLYYPQPDRQKLQIAYMSRKDLHTPHIRKILTARGDTYRNVEFIPLEDLPEAEYARVLRESVIYLTTSPFEGANLSVLEAMGCGCICVGYDGIGGKEYIVGEGPWQNFVRAESMNYLDAAMLLHATLRKITARHPDVERIRRNALATAAQYSLRRERNDIINFWTEFQAACRLPVPQHSYQAG